MTGPSLIGPGPQCNCEDSNVPVGYYRATQVFGHKSLEAAESLAYWSRVWTVASEITLAVLSHVAPQCFSNVKRKKKCLPPSHSCLRPFSTSKDQDSERHSPAAYWPLCHRMIDCESKQMNESLWKGLCCLAREAI